MSPTRAELEAIQDAYARKKKFAIDIGCLPGRTSKAWCCDYTCSNCGADAVKGVTCPQTLIANWRCKNCGANIDKHPSYADIILPDIADTLECDLWLPWTLEFLRIEKRPVQILPLGIGYVEFRVDNVAYTTACIGYASIRACKSVLAKKAKP